MKRSLLVSILLLLALLFGGPGPALAEKELHCAACGGVIGPGRYLVDQWKDCYHVEHANITRCVYCARGISEYNTGGGVHYSDGRDVCNLCEASAVKDDETAAQLEAAVRARMTAWGLRFDYGAIPVHLVDQPTLDRLFGQRGAMHDGRINGLTTKKWMRDHAGNVLSREVSIAMLYGMPKEVYEKTIAHELMHAWMFVDKEPEHTLPLEEGVCNLAAYYMLQEQNSQLSDFMREAMYKSNSVAYGVGLRRAIRYVQANEFSGLVKMLRTHKDFPTGY